jgi:hypothetical protein
MVKTADDSIKNPNHVMMVQKEKKRGSVGLLSRAKVKKRFLMSPRALSLRQKASLALHLTRSASTVTKRVIGSGTVRST